MTTRILGRQRRFSSIAILREQAQRQLTAFAQDQFPDLTCHALIEDGDPATVIRRVAERDNIDLIMMPTKGLGTFRRLLLGSVAAKVLHDSSCAVFTSVHECETRRPKRSGYRTIVCAVELNEEAESISQTAAGLTQLWGGQLSIVYVLQHHTAEAERAAGEELAAIARRTGLTRPLLVVDSGVPNGIRQVAGQQSADLVVVGRGKDQATISHVWSNLYEIVRE